MPALEQVLGRYKPTCFECRDVQSPRDSFICTFADLIRYPALQSTPARVPRLIAAPDPVPAASLRPNNRARAADRRMHAHRIRIRIPAHSSSSQHISLRIPAPQASTSSPRCPSPPRATPNTFVRFSEHAWRNETDPSIRDNPPPMSPVDKGKGKSRVIRSSRGKERAHSTAFSSFQDEFSTKFYGDADIRGQIDIMDSIVRAPPPRLSAIGELGPFSIPLPLLSSPNTVSSSAPFSPKLPYIATPASDDEEFEVLKMVLYD